MSISRRVHKQTRRHVSAWRAARLPPGGELPRGHPPFPLHREGEGTEGEGVFPRRGQGGPTAYAAKRPPPKRSFAEPPPPKIEWGTGRAKTDHGRSGATAFSEPMRDPA